MKKEKWKYDSHIEYMGINNDKQYSLSDKRFFVSERDARMYLDAEYQKTLAGMSYVSRYGIKNFAHSAKVHVAGCSAEISKA